MIRLSNPMPDRQLGRATPRRRWHIGYFSRGFAPTGHERRGLPVDGLILEIPIVVWIGGALALYMAWAIGANDVANAMGTSVGSGALTMRQRHPAWRRCWSSAVRSWSGGHVTDTVRKGILDPAVARGPETCWSYGMLAALASAGTWLMIATRLGLAGLHHPLDRGRDRRRRVWSSAGRAPSTGPRWRRSWLRGSPPPWSGARWPTASSC